MTSEIEDPPWLREIRTLLPVCSQFVVWGNIDDHYFGRPHGGDPGARPRLMDLRTLVANGLRARGIETVIAYDITAGVSVLAPDGRTPDEVAAVLGEHPQRLAPAEQLTGLQRLIRAVVASPASIGLVVESASRLVANHSSLSDDEFRFFRGVAAATRTAAPRVVGENLNLYNPIVWLADSDRDLPSWFVVGNAGLRSIAVPVPDSGDRKVLAQRLLAPLAVATGYGEPLERPIQVLTEQTAGLRLVGIEKAIDIAYDLGLSPDRIDDAARSYRLGVVDNPWRADYIADRLREELGQSPAKGQRTLLRDRVLGQDAAVAKAVDILVRAAAGLTAAQAGPSASRPRGVLFFAGPTGVGKTELAKAVTKLLFDDERFYVRFDMSEFSAEHSADRLIGAPPGYVGFDAGGELTNAMRARPFSVVLLDEVEKAHPRILDKFLQVLDDGRLTDGRGDTVYFTESVIIFTSNLGMYRDVTEVVDGVQVVRRVPAVTRDTHPTHEAREAVIKQSIRDYFTLTLGRPELLNRIGDDNIVVFDFIDAPTATRILEGMLRNVAARVQREHGIELVLTDGARAAVEAACLGDEVLAMGGRGVGSKLETALVNPLGRLLTLTPPAAGARLSLAEQDGRWVASWS